MNPQELSSLILEKYWNTKEVVKVKLTDKSILEGVFVGFFYDDPDSKNRIPDRWHFIPEEELAAYRLGIRNKEEYGRVLNQVEIKSVEFK